MNGICIQPGFVSASVFNPLAVNGCAVWLDSAVGVENAQGVSPTTPSEQIVNWRDQSGNGNDPDSLLNFFWDSETVFTTTSQENIIWQQKPFGDTATFFIVLELTGGWLLSFGDYTSISYVGAAYPHSSGNSHKGAGTPNYYINGVDVGLLNMMNLTSSLISAGNCVITISDVDTSGWSEFRHGWLSGWPSAGPRREILVYDSHLENGDREAVETYLIQKYNIEV